MKIIDERETQKQQQQQQQKNPQRQKTTRRAEAIVEGWELNDFDAHLS